MHIIVVCAAKYLTSMIKFFDVWAPKLFFEIFLSKYLLEMFLVVEFNNFSIFFRVFFFFFLRAALVFMSKNKDSRLVCYAMCPATCRGKKKSRERVKCGCIRTAEIQIKNVIPGFARNVKTRVNHLYERTLYLSVCTAPSRF